MDRPIILALVRGKIASLLRLEGPLAEDPTAKVLDRLVVGSAMWLVFNIAIVVPFVAVAKRIGVINFFGLLLILLTTRVWLQRGLMRRASLLYLAGTWLFATDVIALSGAIHSPALVFYIALPISAAWLVGFRGALWTAGACLLCTLSMALLEMAGFTPPLYLPGRPIGIWNVVLYATVIATVPAAQVMKTLQQALSASQRDLSDRIRAEKELLAHQEGLEHLIEERTAELVKARDEAQAANRSKSMFLANMSHELRTPLNAILGFSSIVRGSANLSDQDRKDLGIVASSGEHLLGLIDEVLDMAKIETACTVVERAPADLHSLVNDTVKMLQERALAKNLELRLAISSQTPRFVRSDAGKLRQVLINLIGNALKFTDEGSVSVRLNATPGENLQDVVLLVDVEDTGIGIADADQARIFDPFVQADTAKTRKGTGLGLSISRHFVQLLGGSIQVESTVGRGSRFHVVVPAQVADASEVMAQTGEVREIIGLELGQPNYRILIVEDERNNWLLLQRLLQTAGFQVLVAESGAEAISTFGIWRPHFIWMDIHLPVMSGLEAARRIREVEGGREVKIVAVTASAFEAQRSEVLAAGFDDFLRKPYRPAEVFNCMALHLGVRYVYGHTAEPTADNMPARLRSEDLAALPAALRDELEKAVISLDPAQIALVVSQVSEQDSALGSVLRRLSERLAYSPILFTLKGCKSRLMGQAHDNPGRGMTNPVDV